MQNTRLKSEEISSVGVFIIETKSGLKITGVQGIPTGN